MVGARAPGTEQISLAFLKDALTRAGLVDGGRPRQGKGSGKGSEKGAWRKHQVDGGSGRRGKGRGGGARASVCRICRF